MFGKKQPDITLTWEWPDERHCDFYLELTIDSVSPQSKGFLGMNQSPSVIGWIPDGIVLRGKIMSKDPELSGKNVKIILPEEEINGAGKGERLSLGIVEDNICIEVKKLNK